MLGAIFHNTLCLLKCLLVPKIKEEKNMNLNFWYFSRPMYPGKHGDTQFFPLLDCFARPQNEVMLAVKSGVMLGQAHIALHNRYSTKNCPMVHIALLFYCPASLGA